MSATRRLKPSRSRSAATSVVLTTGVASGVAGLLLASPAGAAAAATGDVDVVNRETVSADLSPTGEVEKARLYSQLTFLGEGRAVVLDPASAKDVRDLDGFSAPPFRDGMAQYSVEVDGREDRRTLADHSGDLPVSVSAVYVLDGVQTAPEDLEGRTGDLEVTYTVENTTAAPTEVTFDDAKGRTTKTVDLVTPFVGSLTTLLPGEFTGVDARGATVAGDGRGNTTVSWSMVLFEPIGSNVQELTYSARLEGGAIPRADIKIVPVGSTRKELSTGRDSLAAGAQSAATLATGAGVIDANLLNLQAGAATLLDGLTRLAEGADKLEAGLADTAAPGAQQIADGAGKLADGLGTASAGSRKLADGLGAAEAGGTKLADGLGTLSAGNETLAQGLRSTAGAPDLSGGAATLAGGLVKVRDGVAALTGVEGLPVAVAGLKTLLLGLDHPVGAGGPADRGGLLQGLTAIAGGLSHPVGATGPTDRGGVKEGLAAVLSTDPKAPGLPVALAGVTASKQELEQKLAALAEGGDLARLKAGADAVAAGASSLCANLTALSASPDPELKAAATGLVAAACTPQSLARPGLPAGSAGVAQGVQAVIDSSAESLTGLVALEAGLTSAVGGLTLIQGGADQLAAGAVSVRDGVKNSVLPGVQALITGLEGAIGRIDTQLAPGVGQLTTGSATLAEKLVGAADGARRLADGSATASKGGTDLVAGLNLLSDGGEQLAGGLPAAVDGAGRLAAGGQKLADGLLDAADGSGRIADGLDAAAEGNVKIRDGAGKLSEAGTAKLQAAGAASAASNGEKAGMLRAMGEKVDESGAMPYGAPQGGKGSVVYSLTLAAASSDAAGNTGRGAAALALLALASAGGFVVRRRVG